MLYALQKRSSYLLPPSLPPYPQPLSCEFLIAPSKDGCLFLHSLNLSWTCDFLWPEESSGSDVLPGLSPGLKKPKTLLLAHLEFAFITRASLGKAPGGWAIMWKTVQSFPPSQTRAILDQPRSATFLPDPQLIWRHEQTQQKLDELPANTGMCAK